MSGDHKNVKSIEEQEEEEDRRLKNWEKWEQLWKKEQRIMAERLKSRPGNLVVNYSEGIHNVREEKEALEYAKIPTEFDKYRGKPDFYKLPYSLPRRKKCRCVDGESKCRYCCRREQKKACCSDEPDYFAVKTKQEGYVVPPVSLIGIPQHIREEKNILDGTRNIYKKWQHNEYRREQMKEWSEKIQNVVPHWPQYKHLVVVGKKMGTHQPEVIEGKEAETEVVAEKKEDTVSSAGSSKSEMKLPRLGLEVNGINLDENCENGRKVRLFFEHDISSGTVSLDYLNLKNTGLATMRVSWKKIEKFHLFRNFTEEKWEKHGFYFDKRELVIVSGRGEDVSVRFQTENSGNYSESWELVTSPRMWSEHCHVILILESYAYFGDMSKKFDEIFSYIDTKTRNLLIKDILHDIMDRMKYGETSEASCVYGEPELFQMANLVDGRPLFVYNEEFVNLLKEIHERVKSGESKWNYCVKNLMKLVHAEDCNIYIENKTMELKEKISRIESDRLKEVEPKGKSSPVTKKDKQIHKKDKKPKKKNPKKNKSKSSKKSQPSKTEEEIEEIKREPYVYSSRLELLDVVNKLDSPVIVNSEREKYFACFSVISAYFNKMCNELGKLEIDKNIVKEDSYPPTKNKLVPINEQPERLVYEYFEHHYVKPLTEIEIYPFELRRKPRMIRDIPSDDVEHLYATYFNKSIVSKNEESGIKRIHKKKKKDKKSKASKSGKSKKDKASSKKTSKEIAKEVSVQSFNPYIEHFTYFSDSEDAVPSTSKTDAPVLDEDYKYKEYLIVHSCLSEAVDAVVDTLHSFDCVPSYPTLQLVKSQFPEDESKK